MGKAVKKTPKATKKSPAAGQAERDADVIAQWREIRSDPARRAAAVEVDAARQQEATDASDAEG